MFDCTGHCFHVANISLFLSKKFHKNAVPTNSSKNHRRHNFLATFNDRYAFDMIIRSAFARANNH